MLSLVSDRCGHGQEATHLPDERSPVFLQFLDVLYQLVVQFPSAFEFNEALLLFLADHMHSCLFGNFLGEYILVFCAGFYVPLALVMLFA